MGNVCAQNHFWRFLRSSLTLAGLILLSSCFNAEMQWSQLNASAGAIPSVPNGLNMPNNTDFQGLSTPAASVSTTASFSLSNVAVGGNAKVGVNPSATASFQMTGAVDVAQ